MNPSLIRKLEGLIERHEEVQAMLGEPDVVSDQERYRALTREYAQLEDIVHAFQRFRQAEENLDTTRLMLEEEDAELREMAQEELPLAKATFDDLPEPMPPLGELTEVTVDLPALPASPVIPNAAVRREGGNVGVWQLVDGALRFSPVVLGASDLDGFVQVREGLRAGDQSVTDSENALPGRSRVKVVDQIAGVAE